MSPTSSFFLPQVVLLTGSTGHLGACLLYKLVLVLRVTEVYVLVRGSEKQAIDTWAQLMPAQASSIMETGKIRFINGDMVEPNLGISEDDLSKMSKVVTLIIHAAADISLKATLQETVARNCLPSLELARLALSFGELISFVQVSTLYALSFLPDGPVQERLYMINKPETVLNNIMAGHDTSFEGYAFPYARSKHLMECLLSTRYPKLPLMILRPSSIGPAIFQPFELYGKAKSIPISSFCARLMYPAEGVNLFHAAAGSTSGTNTLDEIPVDLVANVLLQNVQRRTRGPVNASSHFYLSRTLDDFVADVHKWVPDYWKPKLPPVEFTTNWNAETCAISRFYQMSNRNWDFMCDIRHLDQHGPLGISLEGHNAVDFSEKRLQKVFEDTRCILQRMDQTCNAKL